MDITKLRDMKDYPGTLDKDRYARTVRQEIREVMKGDVTEWQRIVLLGMLRAVKREYNVLGNQIALTEGIYILDHLYED